MYGLNTPESDFDYTSVVFDKQDYLRIVKAVPDVIETEGNNVKVYSLDYLAKLQIKGNPNLVELSHLKPVSFTLSEEDRIISEYLFLSRPFLGHYKVAAAYLGHLNSVLRELKNKELTAKRVSHAYRIGYSLEYLLTTGNVCDFRENEHLEFVLAVKQKTVKYNLQMLQDLVEHVTGLYEGTSLPDNSRLITVTNKFFEDIYRRRF